MKSPRSGALAAAGPRAAEAPGEYLLLVEAIREGYLLHYESPRLLEGADSDLRLLAGDYLYALGLERLAARGDLDAVRELADLISLAAQVHAENERRLPATSAFAALWLAATVAVGAGAYRRARRAKEALRPREPPDAPDRLLRSAAESARQAGLGDALALAAESIGFAAEGHPGPWLTRETETQAGGTEGPAEARARRLLRGRVHDPPDRLHGRGPGGRGRRRRRHRPPGDRLRRRRPSSSRRRRPGRRSARPPTSRPTPTGRW